MKISMPQEDRQQSLMVRMNHFISAPCLRKQMINRFGRRMSVWNIRRRLRAAEYWSQRPARCPRHTLEHKRCHREWGRRHLVCDLRQWRHCIFSDESRFSLYHSDGRDQVPHRQGERHLTQQSFWTNRMSRSWTGQLGVQTWAQLSMFGIKCQSASKTWMTTLPGVGFKLARKGVDPGREHASTSQGPSGRYRGHTRY